MILDSIKPQTPDPRPRCKKLVTKVVPRNKRGVWEFFSSFTHKLGCVKETLDIRNRFPGWIFLGPSIPPITLLASIVQPVIVPPVILKEA